MMISGYKWKDTFHVLSNHMWKKKKGKRLLLGLLFCWFTSAVGPQGQFPTVTSLFRQPLINIFVLIKQELGNEINYLVLSGESTGLVCPYGRGDAGGVMQGEVPFLAYFSYCAHYLVLSCAAAFPLCSWKQSCQCTVKRKPWDEQSGLFVSRAGWNWRGPKVCVTAWRILWSAASVAVHHWIVGVARRGGSLAVWMQFYWSSCAGLLPLRTIWWFAGVTATTWRFKYFLVELLVGFFRLPQWKLKFFSILPACSSL